MDGAERLLRDLADTAALAASLVADGGEGLCLPVTVALCYTLKESGVSLSCP